MTTGAAKRNIEAVYPLSPTQQGMLFHSLLAPESGVYVEQLWCNLSGCLDVAAFERAWQHVVARHAPLRSAFAWKSQEKPLQAVQRQVELPLTVEDWRELPVDERDTRLATWLQADRVRGFDLSKAPLLRLTLLRLADDEHLFIWTHHHMLLDGWSLPLVMQEVLTSYESFRQGLDPRLPPVRPYRDYIAWLGEQDIAAAEAFWRKELAGFRAATPLVVDSAQTDGSGYGEQQVTLSHETTAALQGLSRQHSLTLNTLVQGAWALLLSRYSGEEDVLFGATMAGRPAALAGIERTVGLFITTLPVRVAVPLDATLAAWLTELQTRQGAMRQFEYSPLIQVQEWSEVPRGQPLFESILVFENYPVDESLRQQQGSLRVSNVHAAEQTNYPLTLLAAPGRELPLRISYQRQRFADEAIARMLGHLQTLLEGFARGLEQPIAALPMLTSAEHQQLAAWNDTAVSYPTDVCLHTLIERQVVRTPTATAVIDWPDRNAETQRRRGAEDGEACNVADSATKSPIANRQSLISYRELNERANQLAHYLIAQGVGPDSLVGVCMERSAELVIALLAVLKAGGAYVPLDPSYPAERLRGMVEDAKPAVILTQEPRTKNQEPAESPDADGSRFSVLGSLPGSIVNRQLSIVNVSDWQPFAQLPTENLNVEVTPTNLAYVIFTSGSTGRPKGAMNEHRGIVNRLLWMQDAYGLTADDRVLQKTPFSFDVSVWEFFWPLLTGATLVVAKPEGHKDPDYLAELIQREGVTTLHFVPPMLAAFLEAPAAASCTSIKRVICSGEALPYDLQERTFARMPWAELHNLYGPTEAAVDVTYWPCRPNDPRQIVPIGFPVANTSMHILDRHMQPAPVGVPGELYIGGVQVGRGYLNQPELTAERFINLRLTIDDLRLKSTASEQSSIVNRQSSIYKTGDLARYLPDGAIEYLGRLDHQVKIRGFRIELGEIEATLLHHPAVREAVVVARDGRLVAYVVTQEPRTKNQEPMQVAQGGSRFSVLGSFLREKLPDYMLPAAIVELEALPLSPNGKVDRKALPAPELGATAAEGLVMPQTPTEEVLAGLWMQILNLPQIGRHASFFDLGGHSLLATRLIARVRESFKLELPLRAVFEAPTLAALASRIDQARRESDGTLLPPITPADRTGPLPVSFAQQRLWFLDQLEPDSPLYNIATAVRLTGQLDMAALGASLQALVMRHESLRTSFGSEAGRPVQLVQPEMALPFSMTDLSHLSGDEQEQTTQRLATADARRPFNLATGPLLRVHAFRLGPDDLVLLLVIHHIIADGWSVGVLVRELAALYAGEALPPLPVQYPDYAAWQQAHVQGAVVERQLAYWREALTEIPARLDLPTDRPRPPVQSFNGAHYQFTIEAELSKALAEVSRREGVTLFMTLLAAFQTLLHRYSGQETVCVGTPIAGRSRPELEGLIGFFINTLVLRADFAPGLTGRGLLAQVKERALAAYAHQDVPFELVVEAVQPERNLSHSPLFQVMLVLNNAPDPELRLPNLTLSPVEAENGVARFDLTLQLHETPAGLHATLEYNTDLFDASTVARMMGHYQRLLAGLVASPDAPLLALPLLGEDERQLLQGWNATAAPFPADMCFHQLVEEVAARLPESVAISDWRLEIRDSSGQSPIANRQSPISYRELNARANQLAHHLRSLGVGPEAIVGLALPRSPELIIAALAVLKAGAAFLPLDVSYPAERLRYMIEDAQPAVLLTGDRGRKTGATPAAHDLLAPVTGLPSPVNLTDWTPFAHLPTENLAVDTTPDALAYVIYTSGSTGKPKGTLLAHQGLVNLACWQRDFFGLGAGSRVLQFSALSFDAFVWELAMALASGAALVLADKETLADPNTFTELINAQGVTHATLPPSLLAVLNPDSMPNLAHVVAAGEACNAALVQRWAVGRSFYNAYGPTEATVCATVQRCDPAQPDDPPIGSPLPNVQCYVLDSHMQPAPIGVPGELYIGGVGVARGYLNRPELTAERFTNFGFAMLDVGLSDNADQPKIQHPTSTIYKTGDLARWRPDGTLHFLGRVDQQVKLRGFRIELGEIEAALRQHPTVADALVLARGMGVSQRLVAYIVVQNGPPQPPRTQGGAEPADTTENGSWFPSAALGAGPVLGSFLRDKLPAYMLPSAIVELERWPLTPSGKIDRAALPEADAQPSQRAAYVAPRTETEATLAALAAEVLGLAQVGVEDNFFALGGHSLLATQLLARVQAATGVAVSLRALFETPTVAGLALAVEAQAGDNAEAERIAALLAQVENLSEEEVQALLAQQ